MLSFCFQFINFVKNTRFIKKFSKKLFITWKLLNKPRMSSLVFGWKERVHSQLSFIANAIFISTADLTCSELFCSCVQSAEKNF